MVLAWTLRDETSAHGLELLSVVASNFARVPPIFFTEVSNALLAAERRERISAADVNATLLDLTRLDLRATLPSLLFASESLQVARTHALTVYDASYLQLALDTGLPLATFDRQLAQAAKVAGVLLA